MIMKRSGGRKCNNEQWKFGDKIVDRDREII